MWKKYRRATQTTDDNMAYAHCVLDTSGYKHTLRICNTYCISTATTVTRKPLNVTLYVLYLSCLVLNLLIHKVTKQLQTETPLITCKKSAPVPQREKNPSPLQDQSVSDVSGNNRRVSREQWGNKKWPRVKKNSGVSNVAACGGLIKTALGFMWLKYSNIRKRSYYRLSSLYILS